ncbi:MAG: hypothetical protein ACLP66_10105, partial [Polyangia bacterium]
SAPESPNRIPRIPALATVANPRFVAVVSTDGKLLASGSGDKTVKLWSLPEGASMSCLFDPEDSDKGAKAVTYRTTGLETLTLPCGSPIPPGMICTCNCVAGSVTYPGTHTVCICDTITVPVGQPLPAGAVCVCNTVTVREPTRGGECQMTGSLCTCNQICTCDSVCPCQSICTCQSVGGGGHYWYPN